jgi:tetratricopeptide (TPR) repeat protein
MPLAARICLTLAVLATGWIMPVDAQTPERSTRFVPLRPQSRQELNRREALKLYTIGLLCQKEDRLLEAVRTFEKALQLDAESAPIHKALIPLYLALERPKDALAACRKVVRLDPGDFETWLVYARQLKAEGQLKEARAALARGVRCESLNEHPDVLHQMYFDLAVLCENAQDFSQAARAFAQAVKILENPDALLEVGPFDPSEITARAAELYERLGRACVQAKKYDQAIDAFQKARAKARDKADRLNYNLAQVYTAQRKFEKARACLEDYLKLQPQGTEAYELEITLLTRLNRRKEIIPVMERYVEIDHHNEALKLVLARQYEAFGDTRRAKAFYLKLAEDSPSGDLYKGLFGIYKKANQMSEVLTMLDTTLRAAAKKDGAGGKAGGVARARYMLLALRDDTSLVIPLLTAARQRLRARQRLGYETRFYLAVVASRANKLDVAEQLFRDCLDEVTQDNEAAVYDGLLKVLWQRRKYEAIVKVCEDALNKTKYNHLMFHYDLSRALPYLGKMDEAIAQATKAVGMALDENRLMLRLQRVHIYTLAERFDKAVAECQVLLKDYPQAKDVHDIRYTLSNVYSAARNYRKAEEELQRILRAQPEDATAYNDLGYIWADQGKNLKLAEEHIRKAIALDRREKQANRVVGADLDKDNAAYIDSLGWVLFRRGQFEAARRQLELASSLPNGDDDPVVWDHLGDVYYRLDQPARARRAWATAVKLFEEERRRKKDQRYKDIQEKLKLLEPETQP